ncbi:MAG: 4-hydroxy-tetrahydrodipicolinate reductase [Alphaproteobacteria bacterium]|nr:4-hydroxy-tetrahydrodipicolinate reductase [Alphaproteobacteria bacterium]
MNNMKIAIAGCTGRMGLTLVKAVLETDGAVLAGGSERAGFDAAAARAMHAAIGAEITITSDAAALVAASDAVIDFTSPEATLANAREAAKKGSILIVGTTGFSAAQQEELKSYASHARVVQSGNFSIGVNLLEKLVEDAARKLADDYDIEIFEMHHRHKKDSPSGTALMLGRAAALGRGVDFEAKKAIDRDGVRNIGDIGFSVQRGGDVVGVHDVMFAGPGETITLKHQGFSREIYATGAIRAALWAAGQKPGLYSMKDVLGD